jgi:hypothetical protein
MLGVRALLSTYVTGPATADKWAVLATVASVAVTGSVAYFVAAWMLRISEASAMMGVVKRKVFKR